MQEEDRQLWDWNKIAYLVSNSHSKKKKKAKDVIEHLSDSQSKGKKKVKDVAENLSQQKKKKQDKNFTCFFCKKERHTNECPKHVG